MTIRKESRLTFKIVLAMVLGITVGLCLKSFANVDWIREWLLDGLLATIGTLFVSSLKMLVVPLVFVSLVCGVCGLDDVKKLGVLGGKTLAYYLATTAVAVTFALIAAFVVQPGLGFNLPTDISFQSAATPSLRQVIVDIIPSNPFKAAVEGDMLQIIFFAILFGIGLSLINDQQKSVVSLFQELNTAIMNMVMILMHFAPFGVFALLVKVFAQQGLAAITPLLSYFLVVLGVLIFHLFVSYSILLKAFSGLSPATFFRKARSTLMFAFSTASSNATIPVTMEAVTQRLGVKRSVAAFTIPLGATINMDGTAIMQGVATVFIAQAYNIDLSLTDYLVVILTATLASIGTAGVPGVGLITLAMVLRQVHLPVEGIALILGVDRLLDMARTAVNVAGDMVVSCVVAKSESQLDRPVYDRAPESCF